MFFKDNVFLALCAISTETCSTCVRNVKNPHFRLFFFFHPFTFFDLLLFACNTINSVNLCYPVYGNCGRISCIVLGIKSSKIVLCSLPNRAGDRGTTPQDRYCNQDKSYSRPRRYSYMPSAAGGTRQDGAHSSRSRQVQRHCRNNPQGEFSFPLIVNGRSNLYLMTPFSKFYDGASWN